MALSVRIGPRPNIEHYLLESTSEGVRLDSALCCYSAIPVLISRYCETANDLPIRLTLPRAIMEAKTHQELTSLAMLGQDFWTSPIGQQHQRSGVMKTVYHTTVVPYEGNTAGTDKLQDEPVPKDATILDDDIGSSKPVKRISPVEKNSSCDVINNVSANTPKKSSRSRGEKVHTRRWITRDANNKALNVVLPDKSQPVKASELESETPVYNKSKLIDRISDYEDIWPSPSPVKNRGFFKPITNGYSAEQLLQQRYSAELGSLLNPAYQSDTDSGEGSAKSDSNLQRNCRQTDHVEKVERVSLERIIPQPLKKKELFTFDLVGLEINKPNKTPDPDLLKMTKSDLVNTETAESPGYAEPYDSLVGKTNALTSFVPHWKMEQRNRQMFHPIMIPSEAPRPPPRIDSVQTTETSQTPLAKTHSSSPNMQLCLQKIYELENPRTPFGRMRPSSDATNLPRDVTPLGLPKSHSLHGLGTDMDMGIAHERKMNSLPQQPVPVEQHMGSEGRKPPLPRTQAAARQAAALSQYFESIFQPDLLEGSQTPSVAKFPLNASSAHSPQDDVPELPSTQIKPLTMKNLERISAYDNVGGVGGPYAYSSRRTIASSVATHYCVPWDSDPWRNILGDGHEGGQHLGAHDGDATSDDGCSSAYEASEATRALSELATSFEWHSDDDDDDEQLAPHVDTNQNLSTLEVIIAKHSPQNFKVPHSNGTSSNRKGSLPPPEVGTTSSMRDDKPEQNRRSVEKEVDNRTVEKSILGSFLDPPRVISLRSRHMNTAGSNVRDYLFNLASDEDTTFGVTVDNFIRCTLESSEERPNVVMRNIRQFMSGIKNYLVCSGEEKLNNIIEQERNKLGAAEFMNIDAIIEGALHKCIIKPLKQHIYNLFMKEYESNGNLTAMCDNIKYAKRKTPAELGVKAGLKLPEGTSVDVIQHFFTKMQKAYSPLKKLENLLSATSSIYQSVKGGSGDEDTFGTDDFLPVLIYVLTQTDFVMAEVEADYMWGLLHPCLLAGEGGYYLTTFSSAINLIKNLQTSMQTDKSSLASLGDLQQGFIKVIIPNEHDDSITTNTLPVRPNITAKDVCAMMAHKMHICNPQDYGLYILVQGQEDKLEDNTCPLTILGEMTATGHECVCAYKRSNAKFVWPISFNITN